MLNYEITFITKEDTNQSVRKTIELLNGKIVNEYPLGRRKFSFPIKKETAGLYTIYYFQIEKERIAELNKKLLLDESVLRFLIVQTSLLEPLFIQRNITKKESEKAEIKEESKSPNLIGARDGKEKENVSVELLQKAEKIEEESKSKEYGKKAELEETEKKKIEVKKTIKEKTKSKTPAIEEKKPALETKTALQKTKPPKEIEVTRDERLKALEEKLDELLKD